MREDALNDDLEIPEITDFSGGVVGKYYDLATQGSTMVRLDPDVAAEFPNSDAVNQTLRRVARARRRKRQRVVTSAD